MAGSGRSMMLGTAAGGAAMTLAACSGDDGGDGNGGGNGGGVILLYGSEPQNPLHPTNTNEVGGGRILQNVFSGLISYDTDGESVNERSEEHTSELQSRGHLVCRLLLEKKKNDKDETGVTRS